MNQSTPPVTGFPALPLRPEILSAVDA